MKKRGLRRQGGFILLSLVVFLFVAALLALGDMRTLAVQQTLVASLYAAENAMAETESALSTMEQFAAFEGSELGKPDGNARLTTLTNAEPSCANSTLSEPSTLLCTKAKCNSFLYPKKEVRGDDNVTGNPQGTAAPLAPLLRAAMDQGLVSATLYTGPWTDVGTPERLSQLNAV
jgi:Tfp pilus assembly protein PilX